MKAISLTQPWGTLILDGVKQVETRKWKTVHRGDLLICASLTPDMDLFCDAIDRLREEFGDYYLKAYNQKTDYPTGVALCVVNIVHIRPMTKEDERFACYPWDSPKRMAWLISDVRPVKQVLIKGKQSIFDVSDSLIEYL